MNPHEQNLLAVCQFCKDHQLNAELVGRWVWVRFASKPNGETRKLLTEFGFRWVPRRGMWAHNCGHPSRAGVGHPFSKYGHLPVNDLDTGKLTAA
jgi:hypothetical protein